MRTYIQIMFWASILSQVARVWFLMIGRYPRTSETSLSEELCMFVIGFVVLAWQAYLLWAKP